MKHILLLTFVSFHSVVMAQSITNLEVELKRHSMELFSISYPNDWELKVGGFNGVQLYVSSPLVSEEDLFIENVNVLIQDLRGKSIDLEKYTSISKDQIPSMIPDGKIVDSKNIKSENGNFHRIVFNGTQNQIPLTFLQYYFIHQEQAYVLTLTCEQGQFDTYKGLGEKVLSSFRFN